MSLVFPLLSKKNQVRSTLLRLLPGDKRLIFVALRSLRENKQMQNLRLQLPITIRQLISAALRVIFGKNQSIPARVQLRVVRCLETKEDKQVF